MTLSAGTIALFTLVVVLLVGFAVWAYSVANRLDRLHVRADLAWQALESALGRRAVVARSVASAASTVDAERSRQLARLADRAERADRSDRETVENQLSAGLAGIDVDELRPQLVGELADAEARVLIGRRFYNDAVRDTRALRSRPVVRVLHLGGTAPTPAYFEIAERAPSVPTGLDLADNRTAARVLLLDPEGRVLLLRGVDPRQPDAAFWITVGGGVLPGENLRSAAVREVFEETGHRIDNADLRGPIWRRVAVFPYDGELIRSEELFFALATLSFEPVSAHFTELERRTISEHRWCSSDDIARLVAAGEPVYPDDLDELLAEARAAATAGAEPEVRTIR
ncbi:NUDIX hydrolase [Skermania piniformis]|uniref:NUDIX domain-containing protein n=1 Tax=Skermania pinensis TaxID=39122 RepID=A0ABX8SC00_9ACTN|nr:NUDIX domain-containing protein [Skermania piniformis]QXQ15408.1 NUDIX domain-containing protein [Skermania piniformis]